MSLGRDVRVNRSQAKAGPDCPSNFLHREFTSLVTFIHTMAFMLKKPEFALGLFTTDIHCPSGVSPRET